MNFEQIIRNLQNSKIKTVSINDIYKICGNIERSVFYEIVNRLESEKILKKIKASGIDGNLLYPLYKKYRIIQNKIHNDILIQITRLNPVFNIEKYLLNSHKYIVHRPVLEPVSEYIWKNGCIPELRISKNERSFEIFGYEKFIDKNIKFIQKILKFNELDSDFLRYFEAFEPFFEYVCGNKPDMKVLIIENKDTWFSLKKAVGNKGLNCLFELDFDVIIYGEGNKITRKDSLENYQKYTIENNIAQRVVFYYWGDLDFEGIDIYQRLVRNNTECCVYPFIHIYELMIKLSDNFNLPQCLSNRKKNLDYDMFLKYFSLEVQNNINYILNSGLYIPQEIIDHRIFLNLLGADCE